MGSLASLMSTVDATIFDKIGETALIAGEDVLGIFHKKYREIPTQDATIVGLEISFDTQYSDVIAAMVREDDVVIGTDTFKFVRRIPPTGDESGKVTLELST